MTARLACTLVVVALALPAGTATAQPVWQTVQAPAAPQSPARPAIELRNAKDIFLAMEVCWQANLPARAVPGMTVRVTVSFTRKGEMFGEPRFTYLTPGVPEETRTLYQRAAAAALGLCNPLPFSDVLGNAAAGRIYLFQFIDRRSEKGT